MLNLITNILFSEETTEAITEDSKIMDILDMTENTSELSLYILDAIWVLVILALCFAFFTVVLYIYKFIKSRKDPYYKKDEDDFLDS